MKRTYQRSQILFFFELTNEQKAIAVDDQGDNAEESMYVLWNNEPISLNNFVKIDTGLFHGGFATSAFDGYLIRINRTQERATVVHGYW